MIPHWSEVRSAPQARAAGELTRPTTCAPPLQPTQGVHQEILRWISTRRIRCRPTHTAVHFVVQQPDMRVHHLQCPMLPLLGKSRQTPPTRPQVRLRQRMVCHSSRAVVPSLGGASWLEPMSRWTSCTRATSTATVGVTSSAARQTASSSSCHLESFRRRPWPARALRSTSCTSATSTVTGLRT